MTDLECKLEGWKRVRANLNEIKLQEKELRLEILDEMFPNAVNCTKKSSIGELDVTASFGLIYTMDTALLDLYYDDLPEEEKNCITYVPKFSVSKYKELENPGIIDDILSTKPSLPTLKVL